MHTHERTGMLRLLVCAVAVVGIVDHDVFGDGGQSPNAAPTSPVNPVVTGAENAQNSPSANPPSADKSQITNENHATPAPAGSPFKPFRYDDDFLYLSDPAKRSDFFDPIKYIPLSNSDPNTFLSFGGEIRSRYEYVSDPAFGLRTNRHDDYLLQRFLFHGDFLSGPREGFHARVFAQFLSGWAWGEELVKPASQENKLDLQQGFGELAWGDDRNQAVDSFRLRIGRQEMGYGSLRLVATRDPTNARISFDAVRATAALEGISIDAFLARPVTLEKQIFDDGQDDNTTFWGLYAVLPLMPKKQLGLDLYYFGLDRRSARFQAGSGDELRHTLGTRIWGRSKGWDHDTEAVFQFGRFDRPNGAGDDILAWTIASNTGYTFEGAPWTPRLGLKLNVASGDQDPSDGTLGTFNPLFPRNNYFSEATLLAPYNFFDVHPSVQLRPHRDWVVTLAWDAFFRYSTRDAVYSPTGIVIPAGTNRDRFVGSTLSAQADWNISRNISWSITYVHFFPGSVVTSAGGRDVDFVGTWLTFRF